MTKRNLKVSIVFACLLTTQQSMNGESVASLRQVPPGELQVIAGKLDKSLLPNGADRQLAPLRQRQSFFLSASNAPTITIVPVIFEVEITKPGQGPPSQCGVYFLQENGHSSFASTVGPNYIGGSQLCEAIKATGIMPDSGPRPRLISIFETESAHGDHNVSIFVLSWDAVSSTYKVDEKTSNWVDEQSDLSTVEQVRRFLKQHSPRP